MLAVNNNNYNITILFYVYALQFSSKNVYIIITIAIPTNYLLILKIVSLKGGLFEN